MTQQASPRSWRLMATLFAYYLMNGISSAIQQAYKPGAMGDLHEISSPVQSSDRGWERLLDDLREARTRTELLGAEVARLMQVERQNAERVLALKRTLRQLVDDLE